MKPCAQELRQSCIAPIIIIIIRAGEQWTGSAGALPCFGARRGMAVVDVVNVGQALAFGEAAKRHHSSVLICTHTPYSIHTLALERDVLFCSAVGERTRTPARMLASAANTKLVSIFSFECRQKQKCHKF